MGREIRRVPLDFKWPEGKVWEGFLMPDSMKLPRCMTCKGDGYSYEARAIAHTFYPHQINGPTRAHEEELAWHDKIGQAEVNFLIKKGRLPEGATAEKVNAVNRNHRISGLSGHDAINRSYLIEFRCKRLGIPRLCEQCDGHGDIGSKAERDAYENWEGTPPPTGEGYQLWETVSEGSPVGPVLPTKEAFIKWLVEEKGHSQKAAEKFTESGWAPSMTMDLSPGKPAVIKSNIDIYDK